jgi:hypothetical protein
MALSKELSKLGVVKADGEVYPRLLVVITGHDKRGKTHFGLTAPTPSLIISSDIGTEGVVDQFVKSGKEIYEYHWALPSKQEKAKALFDKVTEVYYAALEDKNIRSVIIDTESELWELLRLYKFGKLDKIPSYKYGEVNAIAKRMYKKAYDHQKNLVLLRKYKKKYVGAEWHGDYEPSGYNDIDYIVQAVLTADRYPRSKDETNPDFFITIDKSRHASEKEGTVLEGPMCSFQFLANELLPDVDIDFWE